MKQAIDWKRILIFLGFAYGIAWVTALVIYLNGGLTWSGARPLMATGMMFAPTIAHLLTRLITREGWSNMYLRPNFRRSWKYWITAWVLPGLLTILGGAVFFLLFPQYFDKSLSLLAPAAQMTGMSPWLLIAIQTLSGILISPIVNSLFTFGEEFGWRAYLQPRLMPLGGRKAMVLMGLIWGVWHWPVIFMGYEYGFDYPGFPWLGPLLFVWIAFCFGILAGWTALKSRSVWPAVIAHAAINGIAALSVAFVTGTPNSTIGPLPVGIIGSLGFGLFAIYLMLKPGALEPAPEPELVAAPLSTEQVTG